MIRRTNAIMELDKSELRDGLSYAEGMIVLEKI